MRPLVFTGLGIGFLLMGLGLYVLTLRKSKQLPVNPNKSQLREQAELAEESGKLRLAAGVIAIFGAVLFVMGIF
jgi:uncharacterized membrane protein